MIHRILALTALTLALGTASAQTPEATSASAPTLITPAAPAPRAQVAVAVGTFKCAVSGCLGGIGEGVADALTTALANHGAFAVFERENTGQLTEEAFFAGGPAFQGADVLIFGSITQYEPEAQNGGVCLFGVCLGGKSATIGADLRIVDAKTRRILSATHVEGTASGTNFSLTTSFLPGSIGGKTSPQTQAAIAGMLTQAVQQLQARIPANYYKSF